MMSKRIDLTGKKFNMLTAIRPCGTNKDKRVLWEFQCDCGNKVVKVGKYVLKGHTKSCGCLSSTSTIERNKKMAKHNSSFTRLYKTWTGIKSRCYYAKDIEYKIYGGRGITMCDEWKKDFLCFKEWALESGYNDNLTIDRIDVNGNYEPSNCRWVTSKEQANNKRNNRLITYNGETHNMTEWAEKFCVSREFLSNRIDTLGWSVERAFTEPKHKRTVVSHV